MRKAYFTDYCGRGEYDEHWLDHSGIEHCVWIVTQQGLAPRSVLVLGAATGRVLEYFDRALGVRPWGCEVSRWAHARIPAGYRRRIARRDMRHHLPDLLRAGRSFDLCFANSLVYLRARELPGFTSQLSRVCGHLHFWSSTEGDAERGDRYRVTTRPRAWWRATFLRAGFEPTRSRYLWRSTRRTGRPPR